MHFLLSFVSFFQLLALFFPLACLAIAIDDPVCIAKVIALQNQTSNPNFVPDLIHVDLPTCNIACGDSWNLYGFWDIQQRIASWIVPLFILISLAQFAPLRSRNTAAVVLHLLVDPISSISHLLWKLQSTREYYIECQRHARLPDDILRAATMILSAYEEWENFWYAKRTHLRRPAISRRNRVAEFVQWLDADPEIRRRACLRAANGLVLWRAPGLWNTSIGILNYVVAISLAFIKVIEGDFNNRTGHSIAFGMLYSWLIPAVFLTSLVGTYQQKSSSRRVLLRMMKDTKTVRTWPSPSTSQGIDTRLLRFPDHLQSGIVDYCLLEFCGGNASFSPQQFSHVTSKKRLCILATIPLILSAISAIFISYFNPTRGVGCRTVQQLTFFVSWLFSAFLTWLFGHMTNFAQSHWRWTLIKDAIFFTLQLIFFSLGFVGWFNSCFCWSAVFSLHEKAYVVLQPSIEILNVATYQWPIMTGVVLLLHAIFIGAIWWYYAAAVHLYKVQDGDEDDWVED